MEPSPCSVEFINLYRGFESAFEEPEASLIQAHEKKLHFVENTLRRLLLESRLTSKAELKIWLISTIAKLPVDTETVAKRFTELLSPQRPEPATEFAEQLALLACQQAPRQVARLFLDRGALLRDFFTDHPQRIYPFFSLKFAGKNEGGALALEQYLFLKRDALWHRLTWTGRRDVTPVVAIQKKGLLMELDLVQTVRLLGRELPDDPHYLGFWQSDLFKQSLADGEFVALEPAFFAAELARLVLRLAPDDRRSSSSSSSVSRGEGSGGGGRHDSHSDRSSALAVLNEFVQQADFGQLAPRVVPLLPDADLLRLARKLLPSPSSKSKSKSAKSSAAAAARCPEAVVVSRCRWHELDELLVWNALLACPKQVVRLLIDADHDDARGNERGEMLPGRQQQQQQQQQQEEPPQRPGVAAAAGDARGSSERSSVRVSARSPSAASAASASESEAAASARRLEAWLAEHWPLACEADKRRDRAAHNAHRRRLLETRPLPKLREQCRFALLEAWLLYFRLCRCVAGGPSGGSDSRVGGGGGSGGRSGTDGRAALERLLAAEAVPAEPVLAAAEGGTRLHPSATPEAPAAPGLSPDSGVSRKRERTSKKDKRAKKAKKEKKRKKLKLELFGDYASSEEDEPDFEEMKINDDFIGWRFPAEPSEQQPQQPDRRHHDEQHQQQAVVRDVPDALLYLAYERFLHPLLLEFAALHS